MNYEYVVWDNIDNCIHRGPWTDDLPALTWMEEVREDFPGGNVDKLWSVRRRAVGEWETYG